MATTTQPAVAGDEQLAIAIPSAAKHMKVRVITRAEIHPDPEQPRQSADAELRDSIARNGLLQPITVRPHPELLTQWMIVDGERRWRSSEGVLEDLPCVVRGDMEDLTRRLATQLEANTGKPLTPLEEARAFLHIAQATGMTPAEIAEFTGRPKSTVGERLALLDLGPWLPLIEAGEIVMSHAVKVLLPLRTVPDKIHEHAIELLKKDYRFEKKGEGRGISLGDFDNLIRQFYTPSMYPLNKTKTSYHKQPEFNTTKHDQECDCGGIMFDIGGGTPRRCCGNPAWWRPLHRKALAAKKPAPGKSTKRTKSLYLPQEASVVKSQYGQTPNGVTQLTDSNGNWAFDRFHGSGGKSFDPADLVINDAKLVSWSSSYGDGYPIVGTRDAAAVAAARAKWTERWQAERAKLVERLGVDLKQQMDGYRVRGVALSTIGGLLGEGTLKVALEIAEAIGMSIPATVTKGNTWDQSARTAKWIRSLTVESASDLLTAIATFDELHMKSPGARIQQLQETALTAICKRAIPWKAKPKGAKAKKGKKRADREVPLGKLSAETAELPLEEDAEDAVWHLGDDEDADDLEEAEA